MKDSAPIGARLRNPLVRTGLLLMVAVTVMYCTSPVVTNGDSYLAFPTAVSLVHDGDLDLDEFPGDNVQRHYGRELRRGHSFDGYPWAVSLLLVPAVLAVGGLHAVGALSRSATDLVRDDAMGLPQLLTASVVTAAVALVLYFLAYERLTGDERRRRRLAVVIALGFATATAAWSTASRALWQHGPSMLLLSVALLLAVRADRRSDGTPAGAAPWFAMGAVLAAANTVRPTNAAPAALFGIWLLVRHRHRRRLVPFLGGALAVAGPWFVVNAASFGTPLPYYSSPGERLFWHESFGEAAAANLVSPARGLLIFSPVIVLLAAAGLVLRFRRREGGLLDAVAVGSVVAQLLIVSASKEAWWAGHSFGPRFMSDVLPFLAYLAIPAVDAVAAQRRLVLRVATVATLAWSVLVNAQGAYLRASNCWNVVPKDINADPHRVWSVSDPQVVSGWRTLVESPKAAVSGECGPPSG
ncbi:MAG: hypothetical protein ACRD2W_00970 [Acidimicrobiales bacterium]